MVMTDDYDDTNFIFNAITGILIISHYHDYVDVTKCVFSLLFASV